MAWTLMDSCGLQTPSLRLSSDRLPESLQDMKPPVAGMELRISLADHSVERSSVRLRRGAQKLQTQRCQDNGYVNKTSW
jgi:hypothetical protein